MITRIALALVALTMTATAAAASGDKIVHLVTLPGYAPYTFYKPGAEHLVTEIVPPGTDARTFTGYSWDIAREAFHAVGWTVKLRIAPWARCMYEFKMGKVDLLFPTGKNRERLTYMKYSAGSVVDVNFLIYTRATSNLAYDGLDSLAGKTVAVVRGFNYGEKFNNATGFEKMEVNSIEQGFDLLAAGRVAGFAGYDIPWDYKLSKLRRQDEFKKLQPPFDGAKEYLTALRRNSEADRLLGAFDRGLKIIKANGTLAKIKAKWAG